MENNSNDSIESDLSEIVPVKEEETVGEAALSNDFPTWANRTRGLEAYVCITMNVWSGLLFCYNLGKYGSMIIVPCIIFRILVILPGVLVEIILTRYVMGNMAKAWNMISFVRGVFYCKVAVSCASLLYELAGHTYITKYLVSVMTGHFLWETCDPKWARANCMEKGNNETAMKTCMQVLSKEECASQEWETPAVQYWKYSAGNNKDYKEVGFCILYLLITVGIVLLVNCKGIKGVQKVTFLFVYVPTFLSAIIAFVSFLVPEATYGLQRVCSTDWRMLSKLEVWISVFDSTVQSFGMSVLPMSFVSSHGRFRDDVLIDTIVILFADIFTSFMVLTPMLCIIAKKNIVRNPGFDGFKAVFEDDLDIFIQISEALPSYPSPNILWGIVFYFTMWLMSMSSLTFFSLSICEGIQGIFPKFTNLFHVSLVFIGGLTLACTGVLFFHFDFEVSFPVECSVINLIGLLTLEFFYGVDKISDDFQFMMGYPLPIYVRFSWILSIFVQLTLLVLRTYYWIPDKPIPQINLISIGIPSGIYIITIVYFIVVARRKGKINSAFQINSNWGPDNPILKKSRIIFNSETVTKECMYRQELYKKPFEKPLNFTKQNIVCVI